MIENQPSQPLLGALHRILTPIARLLIARGVRYRDAGDALKQAFVASAGRVADSPRLTESRLSVLTGLQRKDIKAIRARIGSQEAPPTYAGPIPRLIQNWRAMPDFTTEDGTPKALSRAAFDQLAASVSTDIHPRSMLDEAKRLGLVREEDGAIMLLAEAYIPGADQAALYTYLGGNLGDHAEAAVSNVLSEDSPPNFERAVHYNRLSPASLADLDALARRLQQSALEQIAARAAQLQERDGTDPAATGRFRCGAFILTETAAAGETTQ